VKEGQTDFLDELVAQDEVATPEPEPQGDASKDVVRDEKGRFAPKGEEATQQVEMGGKPEAQVAPEPAPPAGREDNEFVPKSVVIALRKELQELKGKRADQPQQSSPQQQSQPIPKSPEFAPPQVDWEQDPQHYVQAQIHSMRMEQSKFFAVQQSSEQEVAEAWSAFDAACNADPALSAYSETLINHPHPMGEVVKWHQKQKQLRQLEEVGGIDKYRERVIAEYLASQQGQQPAPVSQQRQMQPKPDTPPSLATGGIGAARASEPASDDVDFDSFFAEARKPRKR
jgi:hypothetical protein